MPISILQTSLGVETQRFQKCETFSGAKPGANMSPTPGEPPQGAVVIPGVHWERIVSFLEYFGKRVYCLPKDERPYRWQSKAFYQQGGVVLQQKVFHGVQDPLRHQVLNPRETLRKHGRNMEQSKVTPFTILWWLPNSTIWDTWSGEERLWCHNFSS